MIFGPLTISYWMGNEFYLYQTKNSFLIYFFGFKAGVVSQKGLFGTSLIKLKRISMEEDE